MKIKANKRRDKYFDLARELKEAIEHGDDCDTNCNWCTQNDPQRLVKGTGRVGNRKSSRDHPNYDIVYIGQNTAKSPGDVRRLYVTQNPGKDHQLTLVWKARKKK